MAKIAFTKLGCKLNKDINVVKFNDQEIEVRQYLPVDEKLSLVGRVINNSAEDAKFYNVGKIAVFTTIEMISTYTNISFTEKQKEDVCKLYDIIVSSGLYDTVFDAIPEGELEWISETTMNSIESIYQYQNSVLGILDAVSQDYSNLNLDATTLQQQMANPENLELLKGIMTRLG